MPGYVKVQIDRDTVGYVREEQLEQYNKVPEGWALSKAAYCDFVVNTKTDTLIKSRFAITELLAGLLEE